MALFKKKNNGVKEPSATAMEEGRTSIGSEATLSADEELLAVIAAAIATQDDDELIAVIGAAIAAYENDEVRSSLIVRKINRAAGIVPAWGVAGNREALDTRRF
jgi:alkylhydroperoxidase/carboxymuconolactone decarboxylase family protein YurZ